MFEPTLQSVYSAYRQKDFQDWFVVDNCYDPYTRNKNLTYIREHGITKIWSKDDDISYLQELPHTEAVRCSRESVHLDTLYTLPHLKILSLETDDASFDFSKLSSKLSYLLTKFEKKNKSWQNHSSITGLTLQDYETDDFSWANGYANSQQIRVLQVECSFRKFKSCRGLHAFANLEFLNLDYCRQLEDIDDLYALSHLRVLHWHDNPKIAEFHFEALTSLEELYLIDKEVEHPKKLPSVSFVKLLPKLKVFHTNRIIQDGDLSPLLSLEDVDIFQDRKKYNVRQTDLPGYHKTT